jgi:hypothetical protein
MVGMTALPTTALARKQAEVIARVLASLRADTV